MAAMATPASGILGGIAGMVDRLGRSSILSGLLETTGLANLVASRRSPVSPFGDWQGVAGVINASRLDIPAPSNDASTRFIAELQERLKDLVSGAFKPPSLESLADYLKSKSVELYTKITGRGPMNMLRDLRSNRSAPANVVVPSVTIGNRRTTLRDQDLRIVELKGLLHRHGGPRLDEIQDYMHLVAAKGFPIEMADIVREDGTRRQRLALTETDFARRGRDGGKDVVRRQAWLGLAYAIASADPEENKRIIAEARARNVRLILPEAYPGGAAEGHLVAGMAILDASRSCFAELIDERWSADNLAARFGKGMRDHYVEMAERMNISLASPSPAAKPNVESFLRKFLANSEDRSRTFEAPPEPDNSIGFGGLGGDRAEFSVRIGIDGKPFVFNRTAREEAIYLDVPALVPGVYDLEDALGEKIGSVDVARGGRVVYRDGHGQPFTPRHAPDPEPGSPRYGFR